MVPFVAKYQPEKLEAWLQGEDEAFPKSNKHGGTPKVPPKPTLEDLLEMKVNVPEAVRRRIEELDHDGKEREALAKKKKARFVFLA